MSQAQLSSLMLMACYQARDELFTTYKLPRIYVYTYKCKTTPARSRSARKRPLRLTVPIAIPYTTLSC